MASDLGEIGVVDACGPHVRDIAAAALVGPDCLGRMLLGLGAKGRVEIPFRTGKSASWAGTASNAPDRI
jgi:hypothetical protein